MRAQSTDFRNVCFPCTSGLPAFLCIAEEKDFKGADSPCNSNRSSASSTSSVGKMDPASSNDQELTHRFSFGIEESVVKVGATAQLRRRNSSLSRKKASWRIPEVRHETASPFTEEWSETYVAQDGILTTNFCSTEL